jgi:hypothetical protein
MKQSTLNNLRLGIPGVITLVFFALLGWSAELWEARWPENVKDVLWSLPVVILGGIYYVLPFRSWSNRKFFDAVSENIRSTMMQISGLPDDSSTYTWKAIRGVFYHFIDSDQSLSKKASLAYFNGSIWTTMADIRVLSFLFTVLALILWWRGAEEAQYSAEIFGAIFFLSFFASAAVTRKHKEIGNQQLEIIEQKYASDLRTRLEGVRDRHNSKSSLTNKIGA